jgi:hypothetical protein
MKNLFKPQLETANPITQELLDELVYKNYESGEPKKVGDIPLWGFKAEYEPETEDKPEDLVLTLFSLCEREFPYYSEIYIALSSDFNKQITFPIFVKKGEEEKYEAMKGNHLRGI